MRGVPAFLVLAIYAGAEELPLAPGVSAEITSDKTEFAIGDPILLDIVYRNDGKETWEIEELLGPCFYSDFEVRDAEGRTVPNPYDDVEGQGGLNFLTHTLPPGGTATVRKFLNECVSFERPGEYVVSARTQYDWERESGGSRTLNKPGSKGGHRCPSKPLKIKILPAPDKEIRDAATRDLKLLHDDPELRKREDYARYRPYLTEDKCKSDALRLLAFRQDQELLPFWLELLGDGAAGDEKRVYRRIDLVWEGLAGLPDRAAVLKALEERLKGPQRNRCLLLYVALAVPKTEDVTWRDVDARRTKLSEQLSK